MPLLDLWKTGKDAVLKMTIQQVVRVAGDGKLRDQSECSKELCAFLRAVPSDQLFTYARSCLEEKFDDGGLVLQDIVNELGRRLDFDVENGLYQGKRNVANFDGIWRSKDQPAFIIEVKTTDYVTVQLEKYANYKELLVADKKLGRDASILFVVGREDTGALEAQVRGSRYAWEVRLIGIEGLIKLVQVKEKSDEPATIHQIRQLLQPFEYTKLDRIIDVIFTTAVDLESGQEEEQLVETNGHKQDRTEPGLLNTKRQQAVDSFAAIKGKELVKASRTLFWSPDKQLRVCCAVSKPYDSRGYWYAYHPKWDMFLSDGRDSFFILSCMDRDEAFAVPYSWLEKNKKNFNMTDRGDRSYWHVSVTTLENGKLAINMSKVGSKAVLDPYRYSLTGK